MLGESQALSKFKQVSETNEAHAREQSASEQPALRAEDAT